MTATLARIDPATQPSPLSRFQPTNLEQAIQVSEMLSRAGDLIPAHLQGKPAAVLATILAGAELGLGMMQSFRAIYIVKGKVGFYADFMLAKAKGHPRCARFDKIESNDAVATFETEEKGGTVTRQSFTIEDARKGGLTSNQKYQTQPAAMLRARCISALVKIVYPDSFFGTYSMDEVQEIEAMEKELNPPPAPTPQNAMPAKPHSGVRGAVEALKARQAPLLVDVKAGESEEEATAKASGATLETGKLAGMAVASMSDGVLLDIAATAESYLAKNPDGKHAGPVRRDLATVGGELDRRAAESNS